MTPLAVLPNLNEFINMDLKPLFAWFLHKYPLKESISFIFLEPAGLGQGRGCGAAFAEQEQAGLPAAFTPETHWWPSSVFICVSWWVMGARSNTALAETGKQTWELACLASGQRKLL